MERAEMRMIRWMCGVSLKERQLSTELRRRLGVEPRGNWGCDEKKPTEGAWTYVERMHHAYYVKVCTRLVEAGKALVGRPSKTWWNTLLKVHPGTSTDEMKAHKRKADPAEPGKPYNGEEAAKTGRFHVSSLCFYSFMNF